MTHLRRQILNLIAAKPYEQTLGGGHYGIFGNLKQIIGTEYDREQALKEVWLLISEGLIYIDPEQRSPEHWVLLLTDKGRHIQKDIADINPYDPDGYLARLQIQVPRIDNIVLLYTKESLESFNSGCYLGSSVMLGVASEKAFLLLAGAFARWLPLNQSKVFLTILDNPRRHFLAKFMEFRKRIEPCKPKLPSEFSDNMALTLDSIGDLIRIYRNESGHPTGKVVSKDDAFINLQMFARYLKRVFDLIDFFNGAGKS